MLDEIDGQVELADQALSKLDANEVAMVKSHYACQILLNRAAYYNKKLKKHGLMTEREAGGFVEEIEENLYDLLECQETEHTDEMSTDHKMHRISNCSPELLSTWNLLDEVSKRNLHVTVDDGVLPRTIEEESVLVPTKMELDALNVEMPLDVSD